MKTKTRLKTFRLDNKDIEMLKEVAECNGMNSSQWLRHIIRAYAKEIIEYDKNKDTTNALSK